MTQFRQDQPKTLADLFSQPSAGSAPYAPTAPSAPSVGQDDELRKSLLDMIFAEEAPPPEQPKPSEWQTAIGGGLSALGDAFNNFAAIKAGSPGFQSNYADRLLAQQRQRDETSRQVSEEFRRRSSESKKDKAKFLYSELDRSQAQRQSQQDKDLAKLEQAAALADTRAYAQKVAQTAAEVDAAQNAAKEAAQTQRNREDNATRTHIAAMDARQSALNEDNRGKAKIHDEQNESLGEARVQIVAKRKEWKQRLDQGEDPDVIRQEWADARDATGFLPEYAAAADAFYEAKMGPMLEEADRKKFAQGYENQGPMQRQMVTQQDIQGSRQRINQGMPTARY